MNLKMGTCVSCETKPILKQKLTKKENFNSSEAKEEIPANKMKNNKQKGITQTTLSMRFTNIVIKDEDPQSIIEEINSFWNHHDTSSDEKL